MKDYVESEHTQMQNFKHKVMLWVYDAKRL